MPHTIHEADVDKTVAIDLYSLVAETDDYGVICCWIYEES